MRLKLEAKTEPRYFAEMGDAGKPMQILGQIITVILTVGAIFAAMNTMYSAIAGRTAEIGTLRALGYRRREILASFQWEAILLTLLGGALGCGCAFFFNGMQTGATSMNDLLGRGLRLRRHARAWWARGWPSASSWASWAGSCRPGKPAACRSSRP